MPITSRFIFAVGTFVGVYTAAIAVGWNLGDTAAERHEKKQAKKTTKI